MPEALNQRFSESMDNESMNLLLQEALESLIQ